MEVTTSFPPSPVNGIHALGADANTPPSVGAGSDDPTAVDLAFALDDLSARHAALSGVPAVAFRPNLQAAFDAGRSVSEILFDVIALRRGPGKLTPQEYFYFKLWDPSLSRADRLRFVGKQAQHPMHLACNDKAWYAPVADKLLFHVAMRGAGLPVADLLAFCHPTRHPPACVYLRDTAAVAVFLRQPSSYPLFGKPADGKYSLGVFSADCVREATDEVVLAGGSRVSVDQLARKIAERKTGFLLQRRVSPHPSIVGLFGERLWSVRVVVLLTRASPQIAQTVVKIATGDNVADNFWREGNLVAAVDPSSGEIGRVVQGTGAAMAVNMPHPDTRRALVGFRLPEWQALRAATLDAASLLPGVRTQSWDVAVGPAGPVLLEVNFGGDLNLPQLAWGRGFLDDSYAAHLRECGYRL